MLGTGYTLDDIGGALSWGALGAFLRYPAEDSALMHELNPDAAIWSSRMKTNAILADIYDILAVINANVTAIGSGKRPKRPKPYPRPGGSGDKTTKHYGSKGLPIDELHRWIEQKRAEYAGSSTGDHTGNSSS